MFYRINAVDLDCTHESYPDVYIFNDFWGNNLESYLVKTTDQQPNEGWNFALGNQSCFLLNRNAHKFWETGQQGRYCSSKNFVVDSVAVL